MLMLWLALQALVYRSGLYYWVAEPESNTGAVVNALLTLEQQYQPGARTVLVLGDSRIVEGFSGPRAQGDGPIRFIALGVPGSSPRTWYYLLREIVRRGYAFDAVLLGINLQTRAEAMSNWPLSPFHDAPLLGLADVITYPASFELIDARARARRALLFPEITLRHDLTQLLQSPVARGQKTLGYRPGYLAAVRDYPGREAIMPSLRFSPTGEVVDWDSANALQQVQIDAVLAKRGLSVGSALRSANSAYFASWLGAIAELAHQRGSRTMLLALPRGPYRELLDMPAPIPDEFRATISHPRILTLNLASLAALEQPQYFFDMEHLNHSGRERMSIDVGARVRALLEPTAP